jgi:eukaryotic-like serine/threonine-protein kinase
MTDTVGAPEGTLSAVDVAPPEYIPRVGDVVGECKLERELGVGGMGVVFLAHHTLLKQPRAVKFMRPELAASRDKRARFLREGQTAAKLKNPHIAAALAAGLHHGKPYLVMEYVAGRTLREVMNRESTPFSVERAIAIVTQVCDGLATAHAAGVVHRDLKPANLMLEGDNDEPTVKILDFGIAKVLEAPDETDLSHTGVGMGSVMYMAPEQMEGRPDVDHRADIYAVGAILYELLTRRTPHLQGPGLMVRICQEDPTPIERQRALPPELAGLIARMLARRPSDRPQSARALRQALATAATVSTAAPSPVEPPAARPSVRTERAERSRYPAGALIALAIGALVLWLANRDGPARVPPPARTSELRVAPAVAPVTTTPTAVAQNPDRIATVPTSVVVRERVGSVALPRAERPPRAPAGMPASSTERPAGTRVEPTLELATATPSAATATFSESTPAVSMPQTPPAAPLRVPLGAAPPY